MENILHFYALAAIVAFAGFVKGAVGLGFPTTALGLATLFLSPHVAIPLILMPMLASNLWQVLRAGQIVVAVRRYWVFLACMVVAAWMTVTQAGVLPERLIYAVLGAVILGFVTLSLTSWRPLIPDHADTAAQGVGGVVSGILGGVAAVWAPPVIVYSPSTRKVGTTFRIS